VPLCGQIEVGGTAGNDTAARKKEYESSWTHCCVTVEPLTTTLNCARERRRPTGYPHLGYFPK
jgi:hypothetical protein